MGAQELMTSARQRFTSGSIIVRRRPAYFSIATALVILYVYVFIHCDFVHYDPVGMRITPPKPSAITTISLEEIPQHIWQVFFGYTPLADFAPSLQTWIWSNQDYAYTLVSSDGANAFARKYYAERPEILQPFLDLKVPVLRSDLLRYMILESEGGVYSDLDTVALKPIRDWIPEASKVHVVVGVEYDQLDGERGFGMSERLQMCQWTMAASKGHPIMKNVVREVVNGLHTLAKKTNTTIAGLDPIGTEVLEISGPVVWTNVILQYMNETTGTHVDYRNMTGMKEPRTIADVMVLPIDGFGSGQPHSNSNQNGTGNAYVRHQFKGSWKRPGDQGYYGPG